MTLQNTATFGNFKVNWNVIVTLYNTERQRQTATERERNTSNFESEQDVSVWNVICLNTQSVPRGNHSPSRLRNIIIIIIIIQETEM